MIVKLSPSVLRGKLRIPASKSCAHRAIICAALADGVSVISGISMSKDIEATISAMSSLGAGFEIKGDTIIVSGIRFPAEKSVIDCNESGSTLRFLIPIAAALGTNSEFIGRGRLPQRPIDIYKRELGVHGIVFETENMPYVISGELTGGKYFIEGDVSSQFVSGLLFALPLIKTDSEIIMTSRLESRPYVDITIDMLRRFGIVINESEHGFHIKGGQKYVPHDEVIEGDYSQAAFYYVANALGSDVFIDNLAPGSVQGDKQIINIIEQACNNGVIEGFEADCSDIPDLVPILTVLGAFGSKRSVIYNAKRLRIKESDRLETTAALINALGGSVSVTDDGLIIEPVAEIKGGTVDSAGDHRIVMAAAIAALKANGDVIINGAEAVDKSYPGFFTDYTALGGKVNVIHLE